MGDGRNGEERMERDEAIKKIQEQFGSREQFLAQQLITLSMTGQPCDVTFYKRGPILDVEIDPQLNLALAYGAGAAKLLEKLKNIKLSNGEEISIEDIWVVNPMPKGGISEAELAAVDLAE